MRTQDRLGEYRFSLDSLESKSSLPVTDCAVPRPAERSIALDCLYAGVVSTALGGFIAMELNG
jgi:hypothetical protein